MRKLTLSLLLLCTLPLCADEYVVNSLADSGFGTLRWAIEQSNTTLGVVDTIAFGVTGTIVLNANLPFVLDPAIIGGGSTGNNRLTINAANTPEGDALWVKANDVRVRNLIATRAKRYGFYLSGLRISVADSEAYDNGSAGFYIYGGGGVLTNSIARRNTRGIMIDSTLAELDGNTVENNTNAGIHLAGTAHDNQIGFFMEPCPILCALRRGNIVNNNPIGIFVEGTSNDIEGNVITNNGDGIVIFGENNRVAHNETSRNQGDGLTTAARTRIVAQRGACNQDRLIDGVPEDSTRVELTSAVADGTYITIDGVLRGRPNMRHDIRFVELEADCFFSANSFSLTAPWLDDDVIQVMTDETGEARFHRVRVESHGHGSLLAAWALRDPDAVGAGFPSDISPAIEITRTSSPRADLQLVTQSDHVRAATGESITFTSTITNNGPSANGVIVELQRPAGTEFVSYRMIGSEHPSTCFLTGLNFCAVTLAAGETQTIEHTLRVTTARGAIAYRATLKPESGAPDPVMANNETVTVVTLNGEARGRAVRK